MAITSVGRNGVLDQGAAVGCPGGEDQEAQAASASDTGHPKVELSLTDSSP